MKRARHDIITEVRARVPALNLKMNGENLVYLDNAATTQKPSQVLDFLSDALVTRNANVHRSMYELSDFSTMAYENAREKVRSFINAPSRENVIFTSGTTASINLVATCFCQRFVGRGDVILIEGDSHHSNIVPWQITAERAGAEVKVIPTDVMTGAGRSGRVAVEELEGLLSDNVKILAITQISNITGLHNPVGEIISAAHSKGIPVLVDGAQGIVHSPVDVQAMDCDFYAFSAHKIYGATGVGVLYGKKDLLEALPPYMGGGDMVETVTYQKTTYAPLPLKFEAGTPNFIGASSLLPALEFAEYLRNGEVGEAVKEEEGEIIAYMLDRLSAPGIELYGKPYDVGEKIPIFTFNIESINAGDLAQLLDKMGVAVRSGLMCAEPLLNSFGAVSALRASFAPYNTLEEAKTFIRCLERARMMLS
ncbi:MAG: aminotransferase class V-fold PLP-dependent enzyme [Bacteroidales bacterium]|nr:aminotransferase class V-fold PLP-dependent enzyme [Bacteroidales bacterium]